MTTVSTGAVAGTAVAPFTGHRQTRQPPATGRSGGWNWDASAGSTSSEAAEGPRLSNARLSTVAVSLQEPPATDGLSSGSPSRHTHQEPEATATYPGGQDQTGLTFAAVPSDLCELRPQFHHNTLNHDPQVDHLDTTPLSRSTTATSSTSPKSIPATPTTVASIASPATSTRTAATSQSSTPASALQAQTRKPSPGLAARLKALGFGSSSKKSNGASIVSEPDHIGRLPEDQLRQLEKKHQANSLSAIIERRGRPWKGALTSPTASSKDLTTTGATPAAAAAAESQQPSQPSPGSTVASVGLLPQIVTTEPLEMDSQKYRLPDHTNGNGTKVQIETRQEHLDRNSLPPTPADDEAPPPPLPKDTPPAQSISEFDSALASSYFTPSRQRAGSIYTLSRASFANQLAQLTSLQLPDAESLSSKVSAIPTAHVASKALINAADQIKSWISKASEVISGLDSDDDVEWSAAGGREGLAEVENATTRFEELINVYISAIEELQARSDIADVPPDDLKRAVSQMESIISEWANIRSSLSNVKEQVEIAMEWEELWNNVLGDINGELDELCKLVFEMEEQRHKSIMAATGGDNVDIGDLETIVEDNPPAPPPKANVQRNRFSMPAFPMSPSSPTPPATLSRDDSRLLALFARMQPLRASLDFLPMRLSVFETRAETSFPTACEELEMRRAGLDNTYKKLEKDAESLRRELGEDRWVIVFRGAGRQAQKMIESVERSLLKLKESVDAGHHLTNVLVVGKKIESYEAKKTHYGPAIERVLSIIDKGVKDRLTVNGEILRLNTEMQAKWDSIKTQSAEMDAVLEEIQSGQSGQQLRDSISSMLSNDRSTIASGHDTPASSPPSSVIMSSLGVDPTTPNARRKTRSGSGNQPAPANRRHSSLPAPASQLTRKPLYSRTGSAIPQATRTPPAPSTTPGKPRWNTSTRNADAGTGHNFKPLNLSTPSPYAKKTPNTLRSASSLTPSSAARTPARSPLNRATSVSPAPEDTPTRGSGSRLSFRDRLNTPGPYSQQTLSRPRLSTSASSSTLNANNRRASAVHPPQVKQPGESSLPTRPASSLASGRRSSMMPRPVSRVSGRETPQAGTRSVSSAAQPGSDKPRWRF